MLVIGRKANERLTLTVPPSSEEQVIEVLCVDVRGDTARLGINASKHIAINRPDQRTGPKARQA